MTASQRNKGADKFSSQSSRQLSPLRSTSVPVHSHLPSPRPRPSFHFQSHRPLSVSPLPIPAGLPWTAPARRGQEQWHTQSHDPATLRILPSLRGGSRSQCSSRSLSSKIRAHESCRVRGSFQHMCSLFSQTRMRCRAFPALFSKASRRCSTAMLLMNRRSPRSIRGFISCLRATKWIISKASACASVSPGIPGLRLSNGTCPTNNRREKDVMSLSSW